MAAKSARMATFFGAAVKEGSENCDGSPPRTDGWRRWAGRPDGRRRSVGVREKTRPDGQGVPLRRRQQLALEHKVDAQGLVADRFEEDDHLVVVVALDVADAPFVVLDLGADGEGLVAV